MRAPARGPSGQVPTRRALPRSASSRICGEFNGQFRIVTGDAGLCARENATLVTEHEHGRWYVFGLKVNEPHLHGLACEHGHYSLGKPVAQYVPQQQRWARQKAGERRCSTRPRSNGPYSVNAAVPTGTLAFPCSGRAIG